MSTTPALITLPLELLNEICSFLPGPADALELSSTCTLLRSALNSSNPLLWYRFFDHRNEQRSVVKRYKDANYTSKDLKYLIMFIPEHLNIPLQDYIAFKEAINGAGPFSYTKDNYELYAADFARDILADIGVAGGVTSDIKFPDVFEIKYTKGFDASLDYRAMALETLKGQSDTNRCNGCMAPAGLLPELWTTRIQFENEEKLITKDFCHRCIQREVIYMKDKRQQGRHLGLLLNAFGARIPKYSHLKEALGDLVDTISKSANASPSRYEPLFPMMKGSLDLQKLISESSVYRHFDRIPPTVYQHGNLFLVREFKSNITKTFNESISTLQQHKASQLEGYSKLISIVSQSVLERYSDEAEMRPEFADGVDWFLNCELEKFKTLDSIGPDENDNSHCMKSLSHYLPYSTQPRRQLSAVNKSIGLKSERFPIYSIFQFVGGPPMATNGINKGFEKKLKMWISKSENVLLENFFDKPVLPLSPSAGMRLNFFLTWVWKIAEPKLPRPNSHLKAGLCKYCDSKDITYYTPFYYAAHLYQLHNNKFFMEGSFQWRYDDEGFGMTGAPNFRFLETTESPSSLHIDAGVKQYGPLCLWNKDNDKIVAGSWEMYHLRSVHVLDQLDAQQFF